MKNHLFEQAATLAAGNGYLSISLVQRAFRLAAKEAADLVDEIRAAGIVGEYDETHCRPFIAGSFNPETKNRARETWRAVKAECLAILNAEDEPARGWWAALPTERRAVVMRAAVIPWRHVHKAWDELPEGARHDLRVQHEKRRRTWALLNSEFSGRVAA